MIAVGRWQLYKTCLLLYVKTIRCTACSSQCEVSNLPLCGDAAVLRLSKVYEQIESLSKAIPIRRSKSISRTNNSSPGASRTASPATELRDLASTPARMRMSSDSISNATAVNGSNPVIQRTSGEKSRVAKIMSRSSSDNGDRFEYGANEVKSRNGSAQNGNSVEFVVSFHHDQ